jgi:DNA-binding NarL/FixJ family response regulator
LTRIGASSRASERARVSAAALVMATAIVPTAILAAATPEKMTNEPVLLIRGATNREVAERLYLSPYTVNSHLRHVFTKLGIRSRVELARLAAERGTPAQGGSFR